MHKIITVIISVFMTLIYINPIICINAEGETGNWKTDYEYQISGTGTAHNHYWTGIWNNTQYIFTFYAMAGSTQAETPVYGIRYVNTDGSYGYFFYYYLAEKQLTDGNEGIRVVMYQSTDGLNQTFNSYINLSSTYTATGGETIICEYMNTYDGSFSRGFTSNNKMPLIRLNSSTSITTIKEAVSTNMMAPYPWIGNPNGGGYSWPDGTSLSPEDSAKYEQIFIVMDSNHDNVVSSQEVDTYNNTYNTNYDYSTINNGSDFTQIQFLYYVATQVDEGDDNPGGGTGEGGGSLSGGITVTDSFTQSQTQSIAENAVNVTIENNNALSQENMQDLNTIINNSNISQDGNAFQNAISNVRGFLLIAQSFADLASSVLGFLPSWVLTLMSLMFSILFIMVIFRIIHLFI